MSSIDHRPFPFSAVVGHDEAQLALLLAAIDPAIGGVLLRGAKGSAKTTLARGLAGLLPTGAPFVELPVGATEDRVLGSIDVGSLFGPTDDTTPAFRPGLLATAHGGVLYVDEVNLLPDHIVDGLLDAAASGVHRVERDGVSHEHPARFVLLGSMNPEEGELRPQLLDRFGLAVEVRSPRDPAVRAEAVRRRLAHDAIDAAESQRSGPVRDDGQPRGDDLADGDETLRRQLTTARPAVVPEAVMMFASRLALAVEAESLRADLVLCRAAAALGGWEGRTETTDDDVARVAPFVLGHRRRRRPFEPPHLSPDELEAALQRARQQDGESDDDAAGPDEAGADGDGGEPGAGSDSGAGSEGAGDAQPEANKAKGSSSRPNRRKQKRWDRLAGEALDAVPVPLDLLGDRPRPRRDIRPDAPGRVVGDRSPEPGQHPRGVAVVPTVRTAAQRRASDPDGPTLQPEDVREPRRVPRPRRTVVFAVDASGSMGRVDRVGAATGAVLGLLADAYLSRDQVAMVAFGGEGATELLPPTASVELARARLADVSTGGHTPIAEGIATALTTARRAEAKGSTPLLVLLTDGRATGARGAREAARQAARAVADAGIDALVLDAESGGQRRRLRLAGNLAELMGGRYLHLAEMTASEVEAIVRGSLHT